MGKTRLEYHYWSDRLISEVSRSLSLSLGSDWNVKATTPSAGGVLPQVELTRAKAGVSLHQKARKIARKLKKYTAEIGGLRRRPDSSPGADPSSSASSPASARPTSTPA